MKKELDPIEFEERKPAGKQFFGFDLLTLVRLAAALVLFLVGLFLPTGGITGILRLVCMLACFLLAGYDVLMEAIRALMENHMPDGNLLIVLASLATFFLRMYVDGAAIMLLYRVGKLLLEYAGKRTRDSINSAVYPKPSQCTVSLEDGERGVPVSDVKAGDILVLHPGDCVAADCMVTDGYTSVDESAITGESQLRSVEEGDVIYAGSVNISSLVQAEAVAPAAGSTLSKAAEMIFDPYAEKTVYEKWAERYSRIYAPVAIAACALFAVLLSAVGKVPVSEAIHRSLVFLVVLSPAALLAGIALNSFAGLAGAAHQGILLKGSAVMESLAEVQSVLFDQEGTITSGDYTVDVIQSERIDSDTLLKAAAHAVANASGPAARAIMSSYGGAIDYSIIGGFCEYPGGISVTMEGIPVLIGRRGFLQENGIAVPGEDNPDTLSMHVALAGQYAGVIRLKDTVRDNASEAISRLEDVGCGEVVMLSQDSKTKTRDIALRAGISKSYSQCTPIDKLSRVQEASELAGKGKVLYVGGASADTAALLAADIGMALGGFELSKTLTDADAIGMDGNPDKVAKAIHTAKNADTVMKQSVFFALGVKLLLLLLTLFGVTDQIWFSVFADAAAGMVGVLNAIRSFTLQQ